MTDTNIQKIYLYFIVVGLINIVELREIDGTGADDKLYCTRETFKIIILTVLKCDCFQPVLEMFVC